MKKLRQKSIRVGMVINTSVKPSRDVMLGVLSYAQRHGLVRPRLFHASAATSPKNIETFAKSGLDGIVTCGIRREIMMEFLRVMPNHPPTVVCAYSPILDSERELLDAGGIVLLDNESIGRQAADYFLGHGLQNFAFMATNLYRERIAGEIRRAAFEERLRAVLGDQMTFKSLMFGEVAENEDYWDSDASIEDDFLSSLQKPCGIFVNSDREAFNVINACRKLRIEIPDQFEVLGVNNSYRLCEQAHPALSSIYPDHAQCAEKAMELLLALLGDSDLPAERRNVSISGCKLVERGSTASERDFGHIVSRAREYVRLNACKGIGVPDVVKRVGVSRRTLEKRIRESTGHSILDMIQKVRLDSVCHLLATTDLPISEVTMRSGYELTSNLGRLFHVRFGMTMRAYRAKNRTI